MIHPFQFLRMVEEEVVDDEESGEEGEKCKWFGGVGKCFFWGFAGVCLVGLLQSLDWLHHCYFCGDCSFIVCGMVMLR